MLPPIRELRATLTAPGAHTALIERVLAEAAGPAARSVYTALLPETARAAARATDEALAAATAGTAAHPAGPLAGLPVTVKDLFDIAGRTTMAGSVLRAGAPAAAQDAEAVARLKRAGAAITGLTNMTEFAYSGVGLNPHHGTPRNPAAAAVDTAVPRIPGGSSSGAAVSVALGQAVAALGSDTGGSIRVPAALCGLVGFKNTQARTPLAGAFPLSFTLDTVCAMTRCVEDALRVDGVLAGAPLAVARRPLQGLRLALPQTVVLDGLEPAVAAAFERALQRLSQGGAQLVPLPLRELAEVAGFNAGGGFAAMEAHAVHREALATQRERFDPRVARRIEVGRSASAADYITLLQQRRGWIARTTQALAGFDALLCPTVPIVAPPIAELENSDEAFTRANGLLLRNTLLINFLDGCAFSLPCHAPGELPVGLMLAAPGGQDATLAAVALAVEAALAGAAA